MKLRIDEETRIILTIASYLAILDRKKRARILKAAEKEARDILRRIRRRQREEKTVFIEEASISPSCPEGERAASDSAR